jgi:hypothetical protein
MAEHRSRRRNGDRDGRDDDGGSRREAAAAAMDGGKKRRRKGDEEVEEKVWGCTAVCWHCGKKVGKKGMSVYDIVACDYEDLQAATNEMRNRVHKHLISAHSYEHGDGWDKRTQNCAVTWQTENGNNIDGETAWKWLLDNWRRVKSEIQMDGRLRDQDDGEKVVKRDKNKHQEYVTKYQDEEDEEERRAQEEETNDARMAQPVTPVVPKKHKGEEGSSQASASTGGPATGANVIQLDGGSGANALAVGGSSKAQGRALAKASKAFLYVHDVNCGEGKSALRPHTPAAENQIAQQPANPLEQTVMDMVRGSNSIVVASLGEKPVANCSQLELAEGIRNRLLGIEDPAIMISCVRMLQERMSELKQRKNDIAIEDRQ